MTGRRPNIGRRLDVLVGQLDDLDWQVMASLDRLRLVTGPQLQRLHHGGDEAAKQRRIRQLTRLSRLGVVTRLPRRIGGIASGSFPSIYTLDAAGIRLLHPERTRARHPWTPSNPYLAHHLAVSELYVNLATAKAVGVELVKFTTEPGCWRTYRNRAGTEVVLRPDAHVVVAVGDSEHHWFVEVDRDTESLPRVTAKCRVYAAYWHTGIEEDTHGVSPRVLWCVPSERRRTKVIDAVARLAAEDWALFAAATDTDAVGVLAGFNQGATP